MRSKIYFYSLLGLCIVVTITMFFFSFRQNFPIKKSTYLTRIIIKNESKNAIIKLNLIDEAGNINTVLDQNLKTKDSIDIDINCGIFTVTHEDSAGNACNWGSIDTCKEVIIIIKEKCLD